MPQDKPRQRHDLAVVLTQPIERDLRNGGELDQRHILQPCGDPPQTFAGTRRAQPHPAEPCGGRLHQTVGRDVVGELVVADLDRDGDAKPASELVVDADSAAHGVQRLLLGPVPVEQPASECPSGGGGQRRRQRLHQRRRVLEIEALLPEIERPHRVGGQEQHAGDVQLRPDGHRQIADVERPDGGAGRQVVRTLRAGSRLDRQRGADTAQLVTLGREERYPIAPHVLLQVKSSHRRYRRSSNVSAPHGSRFPIADGAPKATPRFPSANRAPSEG